MAESAEVKPYQFKPTAAASFSDNESDSDETDTDIREQASFTECLGSMDWCSCVKCISMPRGIECQCCREMESVEEQLMEQENTECITCHNQFPIAKLSTSTKLSILVKVRPQNRIAADNSKFPAAIPLNIGWDCQ